jgi:uncharacterized membrane protein YfcA
MTERCICTTPTSIGTAVCAAPKCRGPVTWVIGAVALLTSFIGGLAGSAVGGGLSIQPQAQQMTSAVIKAVQSGAARR